MIANLFPISSVYQCQLRETVATCGYNSTLLPLLHLVLRGTVALHFSVAFVGLLLVHLAIVFSTSTAQFSLLKVSSSANVVDIIDIAHISAVFCLLKSQCPSVINKFTTRVVENNFGFIKRTICETSLHLMSEFE